jgi:hypothetical protein
VKLSLRGPTDGANELDLDARVLEALAILGPDGDLALDRLAIEVERDLLFAVLIELDVDGGAVIEVLEDNVDVDRGGEEVGHGGERPGGWTDGVPGAMHSGWRSVVGFSQSAVVVGGRRQLKLPWSVVRLGSCAPDVAGATARVAESGNITCLASPHSRRWHHCAHVLILICILISVTAR